MLKSRSICKRFCILTLIIVVLGLYFLRDPSIHIDGYLPIADLAEKYGYHLQRHEVITEDGYILSLFHLTNRFNPS